MDFLEHLQQAAFSDLDVSNHQVDLQGWMAVEFRDLFKGFLDPMNRDEPLTIIEVGSWKGLSASTMADISKSMGFKNTKIICIDTWLGAPEFWTSKGLEDKTRGDALNRIHGYPSVFYTFTKNIKALGHDDVIVPFPISSQEGVKVLAKYGIEPNIVYVDASHEYDAVRSDMDAYWSLLKQGVMFGDDYNKTDWPGVVRAVDEFPTKARLTGVLWSIKK